MRIGLQATALASGPVCYGYEMVCFVVALFPPLPPLHACDVIISHMTCVEHDGQDQEDYCGWRWVRREDLLRFEDGGEQVHPKLPRHGRG